MSDHEPRLRTAVVGVGYFGVRHAEKYARLPGSDLVAVVDIDATRAEWVAARFGVEAFTDYRDVIDRVDAVSISTPTVRHSAIAREFLHAGVHVLVEKPMSATLAEADELIRCADSANVVLQVGHQERLFTARLDLAARVADPTRFACRRLGPFTGRGLDCSVVADLMVHDINFVQSFLIAKPLREVHGRGVAVLAEHADSAEVTLVYDDCEVELVASRIDDHAERTTRIDCRDGTIEIDFLRQVCCDSRHGVVPCAPDATTTERVNGFPPDDLLAQEVAAFLQAVRTETRPIVDGREGRRALETTLLINERLAVQLA